MKDIKNKIHTIRGKQVMLDKDIAELYGVKPIRLREQVKRNKERFPKDFCFQLKDSEVDSMVSQNAIPSRAHLGGYLPYVFTEHGVSMLSGVLKSQKAVEVNIKIMRAFIEMRRFLLQNANVFQKFQQIDQKLIEHDNNFAKIFDLIQEDIKPKKGIFFDGQVFDAHKFAVDLIATAKSSIILIDNYIDTSVLTLISHKKTNVNVKIYTKTITEKLKLAGKKFNNQYGLLEIFEFNKSHDRFLIIDNKEVYHIGASLKDLGKKWFAFSKMQKDALNLPELKRSC